MPEYAIVGFGRIAELLYGPHLRVVRPDRLAVIEPHAERRALAERVFPGVLAVPSLDAMPAAARGGGVAINLVPGAAHGGVTRRLLSKGWDVFSEKPPAASAGEWTALVDLARSVGRVLVAAPVSPYHPEVVAARKSLLAGDIGTIAEAHGRYLAPGPARRGYVDADRGWFFGANSCVVRDLGPYVLSVLVRLLGPPSRLSWTRNEVHEAVPVRTGGLIHPVHGSAVAGVGRWGEALGLVQVAYRRNVPGAQADVELVGTRGVLRCTVDPQGSDGPAPEKARLALDLVARARSDPDFLTEHVTLVTQWLAVLDDVPVK